MSAKIRRTTVIRDESYSRWNTGKVIEGVVDALQSEILNSDEDLNPTTVSVETTRLQYGRVKVVAKLTMVAG